MKFQAWHLSGYYKFHVPANRIFVLYLLRSFSVEVRCFQHLVYWLTKDVTPGGITDAISEINPSDITPGPLGIWETSPIAEAPQFIAVLASSMLDIGIFNFNHKMMIVDEKYLRIRY